MNADELLKILRRNTEGGDTVDRNGIVWATVYLDNTRPAGMNAHSFAGLLSALEKRGDYRPVDSFAWGEVRMEG